MVAGSKDNPITWQFLVLLAGLIGMFITGAIRLGGNSNQIEVDAKRVDRIEGFIDDIRRHDADTTARLPELERRVNQLETWQQAVKRGQ